MLALSYLAALLVFSPLNANAQDPTPAPQSAKRYLYDCTAKEKAIEAKAWRDHLAIAKEGAKWRSGARWQPVFDKYMGKDSKDDPWYTTIKKVQKKQVSVHSSNWIFPQSWVYIYCKEKDGKSPKNKNKSFCTDWDYAYSFRVKGWFHVGIGISSSLLRRSLTLSPENSYNIVFCPRFYREKKEAKDIIAAVKSGQRQKNDGLWMWNALGQTYYHELMHFGDGLINETQYSGRMGDVIKPFQLTVIADLHGTKGSWYEQANDKIYVSSMYLADAYATAANMAYFMEQLKSGDVPTEAGSTAAFSYSTGGSTRLPDLDAHSPEYADADLHYDATSEDYGFQAQGLTDDNLPLLYPDSTISEDDINALFSDQEGETNLEPEAGATPAEWTGPNGPVKRTEFQFFVLPNYSQAKRRRSLMKRLVGDIPMPVPMPIPQSDRKPATLEVFVQDGSTYKRVGPLQIDCTKDQDEWQYFNPDQINTKYGLSIQSGHACSGDASDNNLDDINIKYAAKDFNIARETGDGGMCSEHDGGASCVLPME